MNRLKVGVSPYFTGEDWTDEATGIFFEKSKLGNMNIYSIPDDADLKGIVRALQLNLLVLIEGEVPKVKVEEPKKEEPKKEEVKEETKKPRGRAPKKKVEPKEEVKGETKEEETEDNK